MPQIAFIGGVGSYLSRTYYENSTCPDPVFPCVITEYAASGYVGALPPQLAAMNMTNINPQLLTIEAAVTGRREHIYHAAMLDPHTAAVLTLDEIVAMCDELIEAHKNAGFPVLAD